MEMPLEMPFNRVPCSWQGYLKYWALEMPHHSLLPTSNSSEQNSSIYLYKSGCLFLGKTSVLGATLIVSKWAKVAQNTLRFS